MDVGPALVRWTGCASLLTTAADRGVERAEGGGKQTADRGSLSVLLLPLRGPPHALLWFSVFSHNFSIIPDVVHKSTVVTEHALPLAIFSKTDKVP